MTSFPHFLRVSLLALIVSASASLCDAEGAAFPGLSPYPQPPSELSLAAGADSMNPFFSADSRFLFFQSFADDLVANDSDAQVLDLFQYDLSSGILTRLSHKAENSGTSADWISPAFAGDSSSLVFVSSSLGFDSRKTDPRVRDVFWKDLRTGEIRLLTVSSNGLAGGDFDSTHPVISDD